MLPGPAVTDIQKRNLALKPLRVEGANELVFVLVGLAVIARGSANARAVAGGALGLLGLAVGLSKVPVLLHGVVLSALLAA